MSSASARSRRPWPLVVRRARAEDKDAVLGFATNTWDGWDYIPDVWDEWLAADDGILLVGAPGRAPWTPAVVGADGEALEIGRPVCVSRVAILTDTEAWVEGIRVDPRVRGMNVATDLQVAELRWAAAHSAEMVRYFTGENNEGSHRLGARHGFEMLSVARRYGWDEDSAHEPPAPVRDASGPADPSELALRPGPSTASWWAAIEADPTFQAGGQLYEPRSWALAALTRARLEEHLAAKQVLVWPPEAVTWPEASSEGWALAICRPQPEGEDDPRVPPAPALVAGDGRLLLDLLRQVGGMRPGVPQVRLPDPDPPVLGSGAAEAWAAAGWTPRGHVTHLLGRPIDDAHPLPEPDHPALLIHGEEPRRVAAPRAVMG